MSFGFETLFSSPSPWETGMISETNKTHGSPFHGRPHKKMIESTITTTQTTVMYMACKHEMVNWPKWFDQNPQTSHHINCCRHEYMTATTDSRNHCSQKITQNKFTSFKFQVSQINCFTFPKQQKPQNRKLSLQIPQKIMQTSRCTNSAVSFQFRIVSNYLVRPNWIQKHFTGAIPQDIALNSR